MVQHSFPNEYRPTPSEYIKIVRAYHDIVAAKSDNREQTTHGKIQDNPTGPPRLSQRSGSRCCSEQQPSGRPGHRQSSRACCRQASRGSSPNTLPPSTAQRVAENVVPAAEEIQIVERPGADYMVDVFKSLGFEYLFATPGSSFRGIHESVINHGGNSNPEFITFTHEECSAAAANGYAKIEGKPALVCAHGTVGIQHAAMAIYNAYCDQAPLFIIAGNIADAAERRGRVEWLHAAQDVAATVRDYTKWDDNPASLTHFGESSVRAYQIAMTAPMMPVVLAADGVLQEGEAPKEFEWRIPKLPKISQPSGDSAAVAELAQMLVSAENPVIVTSRSARTPAGLKLLVELAEVTGCGVIDQQRRMNFPSRHPLNQTQRSRAAIAGADLILGLEVYDFFGVVHALGGQGERHSAIPH